MGGQWTVRDAVYTGVEFLVGMFSAVGNLVVLEAIRRTRSLRTVTNFFIGSLAAADTIVGIYIPPSVVLAHLGYPHDFYGCVLLNSGVVLITNISTLTLLAIAIERFLAVSNPFLYQRFMSKRRAKVIVAVTWVVAIWIGLVPAMGWHLDAAQFSVCAFTAVIDLKFMVFLIFFGMTIPVLVGMLAIYLYMFYVIYKQQLWIESQKLALKRSRKQGLRRRATEIKRSKVLALVVGLFAFCWLPLHIMNCVALFAPEHTIPLNVLLVAVVLTHANSVANPFLYAYSNSKIKYAIYRLFHCEPKIGAEPVTLQSAISTAPSLDTTLWKSKGGATVKSENTSRTGLSFSTTVSPTALSMDSLQERLRELS